MSRLLEMLENGMPAKAIDKAIGQTEKATEFSAFLNRLGTEENKAHQRAESYITIHRKTEDGRDARTIYTFDEVEYFIRRIAARREVLEGQDLQRLQRAKDHIFTHGRSYNGATQDKGQGRKDGREGRKARRQGRRSS